MGRRGIAVAWLVVALMAGALVPAAASAEKPLDGHWDIPDTRWGDWTPGYGYIGFFDVKGGGTRIENFALAVEECSRPNPDHGLCLPPCQASTNGFTGTGPMLPIAADGSFSYSIPGRISLQGRFVSPQRVEGTVRVDPANCPQSSGQTRQWAGDLQRPDDPGAMVRPQPAGPGCETQVTVGTRIAWSTCFRRAGDAWTSEAPVRLAGIDLEPREGAIRLTDRGIVEGNARMLLKGGGPALAGNTFVLREGPFKLDTTSAGSLSFAPGKLPEIAGMPVIGGKAKISWLSGDAIQITLAASLGRDVAPLLVGGSKVEIDRGVGAELTLKASNFRGLIVDEITAQLNAGRLFGRAGMLFEGLSLGYRPAEDIWRGSVRVKPVPSKPTTLTAGVSWRRSPFEFAGASLEASELRVNLYRILFLQKLAGELKRLPPPWTLSGTAGFSLGEKALPGAIPVVGGEYPVYAEGGYTWEAPAVFRHEGTSKVLGQTATDTKEEIDGENQSASVSGNMSLNVFNTGLRGFLSGWLNTNGFQFMGDAETIVFGLATEGGRGLISNRGFAACAKRWGISLGFWVRWDEDLDANLSCGWGDLVQAGPSAVAAQAGARSFRVRGRTRPLALRLRGTTGVPAVDLRGPGGQALQIPGGDQPVETPQFLALKDPRTRQLHVFLRRPKPGRWTATPLPGSSPIAALAQARPLPKPRVRARVRGGRGDRRVLAFRARRIRGQQLVFVERGPGGLAREIGRTRRARGQIRFRPAAGRRASRSIHVTVVQGGAPRVSFRVARYSYHPGRLAAPRPVTVRRRGTTAVLRWRRVRGASEYLVAGRLRGQPALTVLVDGRTLRLRGVRRRTTGTLTVRAIAQSGRSGNLARVKLKRGRP
jgi:hypothetical protein